MQFLVTNGGPHPADKWAAVTAKEISDLIKVDASSDSPQAVEARRALPRFALDLADAIEGLHAQVQQSARNPAAAAAKGWFGRKAAPADGERPGLDTASVEAALAAVVNVSASTPFAAHFAQSHVQDVVRRILAQHMTTIVDLEHRHATA